MMILTEQKTHNEDVNKDAKQLVTRLEQLDDIGRIAVKAFIAGYSGGFSATSAGSSGKEKK